MEEKVGCNKMFKINIIEDGFKYVVGFKEDGVVGQFYRQKV